MQCKSGFLLIEMLCALAILCAGCGILASHASYIIQTLAQSNCVYQLLLSDNSNSANQREANLEKSTEELVLSLDGLAMPRCNIEQSSDTKFPLDFNNHAIAAVNYRRITYSWKELSGAISTRQRIFAQDRWLYPH